VSDNVTKLNKTETKLLEEIREAGGSLGFEAYRYSPATRMKWGSKTEYTHNIRKMRAARTLAKKGLVRLTQDKCERGMNYLYEGQISLGVNYHLAVELVTVEEVAA